MVGDRMKEANPLVTVVVPTYNRATLICDALDSVYAQTYRPIELIVVDDGSVDETKAVVLDWIEAHGDDESFSSRYIFQKNMGGNVARNRGIQSAEGEYVAFLDSDDLWHPDKLQRQMEIFAGDDDIGGVYCGLRHVELETGRVVGPTMRSYPSGSILSDMLVRDVTAPTSAYVIHRDVFDRVGMFDEELQARQDWDMWIRLASEYKIEVVPDVLFDYREHSGVRTATNPEKEIAAYKRIMEKYADLRAKCPFAVRQAAKASFYRRMGRVYFHQRISVVGAVAYYLKAIVVWPFDFDSYAALLGVLVPGNFRPGLNRLWNGIFGSTRFAIRSH